MIASDFDLYLFHNGVNYESYNLFCPRRTTVDGVEGWVFHCYAPNARAVDVVGDFNGWTAGVNPMYKISFGVWECFIPGLKVYDVYKFCVTQCDGKQVNKSDPYALHTETPPRNASKLYDISEFQWNDADWLSRRTTIDPYNSPMNVYEMHVGSWKWFYGNPPSYRVLADMLIPYLREMHYTHVELLPLTEYPFDGSWGYQVTGMFAPTSRFGTPEDLCYFVDRCHEAGIGVLLDWVPAHFPKDEYGLYRFDGTFIYEYDHEYKREHKEWGTVVYDYGRNEVRSFLISSAMFWLKKYHFDGLRVDAVASMLYLDYARRDGEWIPNVNGGNINLEAVSFLREMNTAVLSANPGAITIAEESTAFEGVTRPTYAGGLGFCFKWNMGWMHDTLQYFGTDPLFRKYVHDKLTFSYVYVYSENYIMPLSHDEVVHGKYSLLNKMFGPYDDKFKALKVLMSYQMAFVGKKLSFMGGEFAQVIEWAYRKELDWMLLEYPRHNEHRRFIARLNETYLNYPCFYDQDSSTAGFNWLMEGDRDGNTLIFRRNSKSGDYCVCILNFSPVRHNGYRFGVPDGGEFGTILCSDDVAFGGAGEYQPSYFADDQRFYDFEHTLTVDIPAYGAMFLYKHKDIPQEKEEPKETKKSKGSKQTKQTKQIKENKETKEAKEPKQTSKPKQKSNRRKTK